MQKKETGALINLERTLKVNERMKENPYPFRGGRGTSLTSHEGSFSSCNIRFV